MIQLEHVSKRFETGKQTVEAVKDVSLHIEKGTIAGIIGFSGAGKSTLARCVNLLERPTEGRVIVGGSELTALSGRQLREKRKKIGMIFQHFNLFASRTVYGNVAYPLRGSGRSKKEIEDKVKPLLELVGLSDKADAYPSQLSGGQKQRVAIARALASDPEVLLSDEATSALDVSVQAQIIGLLKRLKEERELTYLFISHNLSVVRYISDRIGVMYLGNMVEVAETDEIFSDPRHPYTIALLSSIPTTDPDSLTKERIILEGNIPSPIKPPSGCKFHTRCFMACDKCKVVPPTLTEVKPGHFVACHFAEQQKVDAEGNYLFDVKVATNQRKE